MQRKAPMKRSGFKRKSGKFDAVLVQEVAIPALVPIPIELRQRVKMARADTMAEPVSKNAPWRSEAWRRAVATLACAECGKAGPSQAAHINHLGKGMGTKPSDAYTVPLCPEHHAEYDQGKGYTKAERHDAATGWLIVTINELARKGLVRA